MLSHMDEVLGTRYCEPTAMKANMIMMRAMQLIMKGTFNRADLAGSTGTRWQMLDELVESCSAEDVGKLQDARGAPSGPASSMISTPRQRRAWRRLRILHGGAIVEIHFLCQLAELRANRAPLLKGRL